jgi:hypothetical protein
VLEMQGRQQDGIAWLDQQRAGWAENSFFAVHQWWHLALYHFDLQQYPQVLDVYDQGVRREPSKLVLNLIDASSLLWRLALADAGIDCSARAAELAAVWQSLATDALSTFNDIHAMMAFALAAEDTAAQTLLRAQQDHLENNNNHNSNYTRTTRAFGVPLCRGLLAFSRGRYAETVDDLLPVRYALSAIGGSHAQRDVCALTLLEAALRSGRKSLAQALLAERQALKPASVYNRAKFSTLGTSH